MTTRTQWLSLWPTLPAARREDIPVGAVTGAHAFEFARRFTLDDARGTRLAAEPIGRNVIVMSKP